MFHAQSVFAIVAPIDPTRVADLRRLLAEVSANPDENSLVPFSRHPDLHFSSFVIFERPELRPTLVWEINFDGDLASFLSPMLELASGGLNQIWSCCENYPGPGRLQEYLTSCAVPAGLYHIGTVGRSVVRIKDEARLRNALRDRLCHVRATSAVDAARQLREYVQSERSLAWALQPQPPYPPGQTTDAWIRSFLALPIALRAACLVPIIRLQEPHDHEDHEPIPHAHLHTLLATEDQCALNHMASVTRVKPGKVRLLFLRLLLRFGNIAVRTQTHGTLQGIPGIHYAHWSLIDDGRWLMFMSNYTGSWTSYLDDFIDRASKPLSLLWSNTGGFPRTRWLIFGGAKNGPLFKTYARNSQAETLVWYSAYPDLPVQEVNKNTEIRNRLSNGTSSEEQQRIFLQML